jgi:hypothetical protein
MNKKPSDKQMRHDVAMSVRAKAEAIADGDYDKDVDFNLRDRVFWAHRLYTIADKIEAKQKLTAYEHDDLCACGNYLPHDNYTPFLIREL